MASVFLFCSLEACAGGCSFNPSLNPRMPSARPLPSSGSFFGPNRIRAINATNSQCQGENSPTKTSTQLYVAAGSRVRQGLGEVKPWALDLGLFSSRGLNRAVNGCTAGCDLDHTPAARTRARQAWDRNSANVRLDSSLGDALWAQTAILDCEIICLDDHGEPQFC